MTRRLAATIVVGMLVGLLSACGGGDGTTVTAEFRDSAGLFDGADVGVLGVRVGEVTQIDPVGSKVRVTLKIDPGVKVPADAGAVIVSRSVATDRYVELTPVYESGATMRDGATIVLGQTRNPVEFDEVLASVDELATAVAGPDGKSNALGDMLSVGADTLDGNGARIAQTVSDLGKALGAFNDGSGDAIAVLNDLDALTSTLASNDKTVRRFSDQLTSATDLFDDESQAMEDTIDALTAMLREVAAFVRENRSEIGSQLDDITTLSQSLLEHQGELGDLVETMPLFMQNLDRAVDGGRLTMKVRPGDLVPGKIALEALCKELPVAGDLCAGLDSTAGLLDLLKILRGEGQ
ncbi:MCE family protein [Aeromicrobium sp.]|uniref:MCE family protein n=1 Tax=Aeromicrobium sp. TaxID=1871063 RepID=UPI0030BD72D2